MRYIIPLALFVTLSVVVSVEAQPVPSREPSSTHIFPAGGQRGTVVPVRLGGECLPPNTKFRLWGDGLIAPAVLGAKVQGRYEPSPRRKPTLIPISYPKEWESTIAIAANAPLGPKWWNLTCARGGTGTRPFIVGELPEFIETESNSVADRAERITLPVTVNGQIAGERDLDFYQFAAEEGDVVVCDLLAGRIGSPLDPIVEIRDLQGRRLSAEEIRVGNDPVLAFRAPAKGDYLILVANLSFHGAADHVYRMTVSTAPYVHYAFPPGGQAGQTRKVQFFALSGTGTPKTWTETVTFPSRSGEFQYQRSDSSAVRLLAGELPDLVEAEDNGAASQAMKLTVPATVNGRFATATDEDWFSFEAKKGQAFTIRCGAFPAGSSFPTICLINQAGKPLAKARSVDAPGRMCQLQWNCPGDGQYWIRVRDIRHGVQGGSEWIYRLTVRAAQPDFKLNLNSCFANVVQEGKTELEVKLERIGGYAGPVDLTVGGLPEGVRAKPVHVAAKKTTAKIVLQAGKEARPADAAVRVIGRATIDGKTVQRIATAPHLAVDPEGASAGPPTTSRLFLTVQHKPVFRLFCSEAYQYAHRGTVHLYEMEVERLGDFKGEIVLQAGDRQNRDMDGVEILQVVVPPGVTKLDVPIYMPETMHPNVVSLSQLYVQGYALFKDKWGQEQSTLVVSEKRNLIRTMPEVVKLKPMDQELIALRGKTTPCRLRLERTANFTGPMEVTLVEPVTGIAAQPVRIEAGQTMATVNVHVNADMEPEPDMALKFRAVGKLPNDITVITEASVSLALN